MVLHRTCFAAAVLGLAACGAPTADVDVAERVSTWEPLAVAQAVYAIEPTTPADFYKEADPYPDRLTLTAHVARTDIEPGSVDPDFAVCSDSQTEAAAWSDAAAENMSDQSQRMGDRVSDWYYQFDHDLGASPPVLLQSRVFRCAALDRSVVADGVVARINLAAPLASDLKFVVEYLWNFSASNNALSAVIRSQSLNTTDVLEHELLEATARKFQGAGGCDRIQVVRVRFRLDPMNSLVTRSSSVAGEFDAKLEAGAAVLCE